MKNKEFFKLLGGIDERFLNEAEAAVKTKKKRAKILGVLLPAAAAAALLAVLLAVVLPLAKRDPAPSGDLITPLSPVGPEERLDDDLHDLSYQLFEDHAVITDYHGPGGFDVPEQIGGQPVTKIDMTGNDAASDPLPPVIEMRISGKNLTELRMPENVKVRLTVGESVEFVEPALLHNSAVTSVSVHENNAVYASLDGILYTNDLTTLIACPEGSAVVRVSPDGGDESCARLPEGLKTVSAGAFENCASVKEIVLPDGVSALGDRAFNGCARLRGFYLPASVVSAGEELFAGCENLRFFETSLAADDFKALDIALPSSGAVYAALPGCADQKALDEAVACFERAEEALSFFSRFNNIPCDAGVSYGGRFLVMFGGLASMEDLERYVYSYIDGPFDCGAYDPYIEKARFANGPEGLYTALADLPMEYNAGERAYALEENGDGTLRLTVRVSADCGTHKMIWEDRYLLKEGKNGLRLCAPLSIPIDGWYPLYILEINY